MNKNTIMTLKRTFDALQQMVPDSDVEFWYARELMPELGYDRWENFSKVIQKAAQSCKTVGASVENHFVASRRWSPSDPGQSERLRVGRAVPCPPPGRSGIPA